MEGTVTDILIPRGSSERLEEREQAARALSPIPSFYGVDQVNLIKIVNTTGTCTKKLRVCDPDIKIILKSGEAENSILKEYNMHMSVLAGLSNFFDTSLSVEMKERATKEIVLKDVLPELFEKAIKFQQDPRAIRSMTAYDSIELVEFYDKYEFVGGLELCDDILSEVIWKHRKHNPQKACPKDLDLIMRAVMLAKEHGLAKTSQHGIAFLREDFKEDSYGCLPYTEEHCSILQPFFKEGILRLPPSIRLEDLNNPLFARHFMLHRTNNFLVKELHDPRFGMSSSLNVSVDWERSGDGGLVVTGRDGKRKVVLWKELQQEGPSH